jgi:hypothetical protein
MLWQGARIDLELDLKAHGALKNQTSCYESHQWQAADYARYSFHNSLQLSLRLTGQAQRALYSREYA